MTHVNFDYISSVVDRTYSEASADFFIAWNLVAINNVKYCRYVEECTSNNRITHMICLNYEFCNNRHVIWI